MVEYESDGSGEYDLAMEGLDDEDEDPERMLHQPVSVEAEPNSCMVSLRD